MNLRNPAERARPPRGPRRALRGTIGACALAAAASCVLEPNPAFDGGTNVQSTGPQTMTGSGDGVAGTGTGTGTGPALCDDKAFAFAVIADNDESQAASVARVLDEIVARQDVRFVLSAGDAPTLLRLREAADAVAWDGRCGAPRLPLFPAVAHAELADDADLAWWSEAWATEWVNAASDSPLATQLPGITDFSRGPVSVQGVAGFEAAPHGTMYGFDYQGAHFAVTHSYLRGGPETNAGVWDETGARVDEPEASQLDWLAADLQTTSADVRFVVGHVAVLAPCYNTTPPNAAFACPGPPPPGWSEHNGPFHSAELAALLADTAATAYFHGHDEVPSRMLLDGARTSLFERKYWEVANDENGAAGVPSDWESAYGPGRYWQVDSGGINDATSSYLVVTVGTQAVLFELWRYTGTEPTQLWDTWSTPR